MNLLSRVNQIVRSDISLLVSTAEDSEKILNQFITEVSEDLIQLRQKVSVAIASQQESSQAKSDSNETLTQDNFLNLFHYSSASEEIEEQLIERQLKGNDQQLAILKPLLWQLESKLTEAKLVLANLGGDSDFEQFSGFRKPNSPPSGSNGAEANPEVDGQASSTIP